ncbi:MAG: hypothetical protein WCY10_05685 [Candidatus Omnitrophota bacterium]|jgi:hypothetical protein
MHKKIIILFALIAVVWWAGSAVSQQEQVKQDPGYAQLLNRVVQISDTQRQAMQKLDTVIANQQKIMSELDIVKIRATRR